MQRFRMRKPETIPLLFIIAATLLLVSLGIWQLERLSWKNNLIAGMQAAQAQDILGNLPAGVDAARFVYRRADLTGSYLPEKGLRFIGHQSMGYVWEVPFKLEDSDVTVLVQLPWLPAGREPELDKQMHTVRGVLRLPREKRLFSPDNHPDSNVWFTEDLPQIERAINMSVAPLVLDTSGKPSFRNDHLGYAITWFSLAVIGLVMFMFYYRVPDAS